MTEDTQRKRILLIEDHEDSAEMMKLLLDSRGYDVEWVSTAADALRVYAEQRLPDLVLLDLTLPDLDGLELGRRLSAVGNAPPIVVMSAKSARAVELAAEAIAAAGYVRKPFATDKLIASIQEALARA